MGIGNLGKKVRVYYNVNKGDYTVQDHIKGVGWRKLLSSQDVLLEDVEFKVYESGRQRCLREKKKNVHAYAIGTLRRLDSMPHAHFIGYTPINYNPYEAGCFVADGQPIHGAESVSMSKNGVQGWGLICNS